MHSRDWRGRTRRRTPGLSGSLRAPAFCPGARPLAVQHAQGTGTVRCPTDRSEDRPQAIGRELRLDGRPPACSVVKDPRLPSSLVSLDDSSGGWIFLRWRRADRPRQRGGKCRWEGLQSRLAGIGDPPAGSGEPLAGDDRTMVGVGRAMTDAGQTSASVGRSMASVGETATNAGQSLADAGRSTTNAGERPTNVGDTATNVGQSLAAAGETGFSEGKCGRGDDGGKSTPLPPQCRDARGEPRGASPRRR